MLLEKNENVGIRSVDEHRATGYPVVQIASKRKSCHSIWKSTSRSLYADLNWATEFYLNEYLGLKLPNVRKRKKANMQIMQNVTY